MKSRIFVSLLIVAVCATIGFLSPKQIAPAPGVSASPTAATPSRVLAGRTVAVPPSDAVENTWQPELASDTREFFRDLHRTPPELNRPYRISVHGKFYDLVFAAHDLTSAQTYTASGKLLGNLESHALLSVHKGAVLMSIREDAQMFTLNQPVPGSEVHVRAVGPSRPCGGDVAAPAAVHRIGAKGSAADLTGPTSAGLSNPTLTPAADTIVYTLDTIIGYPPSILPVAAAEFLKLTKVKPTAEQTVDQIESHTRLTVLQTNAVMANTAIPVVYRLLTLAQTDEVAESWIDNLTQLGRPKSLPNDTNPLDPTGRFDNLLELADAMGADQVSVWMPGVLKEGYSGLGYYSSAYAIFRYAEFDDMAPTHEWGHNLGCAHDRENFTPSNVLPYAHGYRFTHKGVILRTIMAYAPGTRVPYFSSPNINYKGEVPVGTATEDNRRAIIASVARNAAFKPKKTEVEAHYKGRFINLATRGFVGKDEGSMIAGFVVTGASPKKLLVRGIGPALTGFGVTGAVDAPKLVIVDRDGKSVATNQGWNAGAVPNSVMAAVGAFPLPAGARDAVISMTVSPGAYTAVMSSTAVDGTGLIEVYEIDHLENKLINVSTRATVSPDAPLIGGLAIKAAAGETKRIAVRVLSTTLRDYGIQNSAGNLKLRIFDATGQEIASQDDWFAGSQVGLLKYYKLDPKSAQEPAIILDLPAGNYSAMTEAVAGATGVALIEAYEISLP